MKRDSFVFMRSWYEAIFNTSCTQLNDKDRLDAVQTICEYALNNIEIRKEEKQNLSNMVLCIIKPVIDKANRNYENKIKKKEQIKLKIKEKEKDENDGASIKIAKNIFKTLVFDEIKEEYDLNAKRTDNNSIQPVG